MQRVQFNCDECEVTGTIRLPDECDDYQVEFCPACGSPLALDDVDE